MAFVRVEQRNAHLAGPVRLDTVNGREGKVAKATLTAISNSRRGSAEDGEQEATAILWTLWGKQAENAAEYLSTGSHVNVIGRLRNNNYQDSNGADVYALSFTVEEIDYLDSRAETQARRERLESGERQARSASTASTASTASSANQSSAARASGGSRRSAPSNAQRSH
jgi:single-strand DNA-binding protein